jgi:hypothetical protein
MDMVTFCDINDTEMDGVDPNMIKLFQLSQLIIEFLLHSQSCLLKERNEIIEQFRTATDSMAMLEGEVTQKGRELDEAKKELKTLKKTLFVYEIMSKKPGIQGNGSDYFQCQYCSKAFSTLEFRIAHERRRHGPLLSPKVEDPPVPKEVPPSKEFVKVVELIELMTKSRKEEQEKIGMEEKELKAEKMLQQERLRFERELQEITAKMHQKMEEEMYKLQQDREAFEKLVNTQGKNISHVGTLEDDEDKDEQLDKDKRHQDEIKELHLQHQQDLAMLQQRMIQEMQILRESMRLDHSNHSKAMEAQLAQATREIEYLKAKQETSKFSTSEAVATDSVLVRMSSIPEMTLDPVPVAPKPAPIVLKDEPPLPPKVPSIERLYQASSVPPSSNLLGWKQYLEVMKRKSIVEHPQNKYAKGMYQHHLSEIQGKKEILKLEMEQFLAEYGLTNVTVSKGLHDPSIQSCFQQLSDVIQNGRDHSKKKMYYEEMRQYLDTLLDSAASQVGDFTSVAFIPLATRKSSLRKPSIRPSSPASKVVRISEKREEKIIESTESLERISRESKVEKPKIKIPVELSSPIEKETMEAMDRLKQMNPSPLSTPNRNASPSRGHLLSPYSQYFGISSTATSPLKRSLSNTKEKLSQAVSKVAKSLSFSRRKKTQDNRFDQAMARYQSSHNPQTTTPFVQSPSHPPPALPANHVRNASDSAEYETSENGTKYSLESSYYTSSKSRSSKDEDSTSTVSAPKRLPPNPPKKVVVVTIPDKKLARNESEDSDLSFSISDPTQSSIEVKKEEPPETYFGLNVAMTRTCWSSWMK